MLVGYRLFNDIFYAKNLNHHAVIGDFASVYNKVSEFLYAPQEMVEGFSIKREYFLEIINDKSGKHIRAKIEKIYKKKIREPVVQHRDIQARKFQTRIDYVDLSAFGVGVNFDDFDHYKADVDKVDYILKKYCSKYGRIMHKLEDIEKNCDKYMA